MIWQLIAIQISKNALKSIDKTDFPANFAT